MATPACASHLYPADPNVVRVDMEEPSSQLEDDETTPLRTEDSIPNADIDYVLVYERCPEEEDKDEESKEEAKALDGMRKRFEKSLTDARLILEHPDAIPDKRQLVSLKCFCFHIVNIHVAQLQYLFKLWQPSDVVDYSDAV